MSNLPKETDTEECAHSTDFFLEKGLHLKSNRFEQNIEKLWMQDGKVEEVE